MKSKLFFYYFKSKAYSNSIIKLLFKLIAWLPILVFLIILLEGFQILRFVKSS